eukprot:scaffold199560_cov17-Tisochrysis_lutea.AAC.2
MRMSWRGACLPIRDAGPLRNAVCLCTLCPERLDVTNSGSPLAGQKYRPFCNQGAHAQMLGQEDFSIYAGNIHPSLVCACLAQIGIDAAEELDDAGAEAAVQGDLQSAQEGADSRGKWGQGDRGGGSHHASSSPWALDKAEHQLEAGISAVVSGLLERKNHSIGQETGGCDCVRVWRNVFHPVSVYRSLCTHVGERGAKPYFARNIEAAGGAAIFFCRSACCSVRAPMLMPCAVSDAVPARATSGDILSSGTVEQDEAGFPRERRPLKRGTLGRGRRKRHLT